MNFEPCKCVILVLPVKIGTHKNKVFHGIGTILIFLFFLEGKIFLCFWKLTFSQWNIIADENKYSRLNYMYT